MTRAAAILSAFLFACIAMTLFAQPQLPSAPVAPQEALKEVAKADPPKFARGAVKTPRHKLLAAKQHSIKHAAPSQVAYVPKKMDVWGNNQFGDCVSAEEAFNQDCSGTFVDSKTVVNWASTRGFLNGANLTEVMDAMATHGFIVGEKTYGDGPYTSVSYGDEATLKNALSIGVVKIAIDAGALPSGAGNGNGWVGRGGREGQFGNIDHCVALAGYGPAGWLCQQLGTALPSNLKDDTPMYLLFTWGTIGLVDHAWLMSCCAEAWLRNPGATIDGKPQPNPGPTPSPTPDPGPQPKPPTPPGPGPTPTDGKLTIDPVKKEVSLPSDWSIAGALILDVRGLSTAEVNAFAARNKADSDLVQAIRASKRPRRAASEWDEMPVGPSKY